MNLEQFQGVSDQIAIGDICNMYLYSSKAPERIRQYIPDVKLIVILRNPIDRAYSNFLHPIRDNHETINSFAEVIEVEADRIFQNYWWSFHYFNIGLYFEQLKRYFDTFNYEQIKVYLYEDLNDDPKALFKEMCRFLEINQDYTSQKILLNTIRQEYPKISFYKKSW